MRRHVKASSAGTTHRRIADFSRLLAVIAASSLAMALTASSAGASQIHPFLETFGSAAQPSLNSPKSLAIEQSGGDLLAIESDGVSRWNPDGTPAEFSALGSNVIDGLGTGDGGAGGLSFGGPREVQVAVDNSGTSTDGDIYVTQGGKGLIDVFASTGAYLGQLTASSEGPFSEPCGVAVAPLGAVYVGDYGGKIHKFAPSANPPVNADSTANFSYASACTLAAGAGPSAGYVFADSYGGELSKLDDTTGAVQYSVAGDVTTDYVDPSSGHLYAVVGAEFKEFDASGAGSATLISTASLPSDANGIAVDDSTGHVYISRAGSPTIDIYGPGVTVPTVSVEPGTGVLATKAILNGVVNPEGVAVTECIFEYGPVDSSTYPNSIPCEQTVPTDSSDHSVSAEVSGLSKESRYHYRLTAKNANGTSTSSSGTFQTLSEIGTEAATGASQSGATLNGTVRPEGQALSECEFEFGTESPLTSSIPCTPEAGAIPSDFSPHAVTADLSGLAEATTYYFRLKMTTAEGTQFGEVQSFTTPGRPQISEESSLQGQAYAAIGGYIAPSGSDTTYHFEWGTTTSYGSTVPAGPDPSIGAGTEPVPVSAQLGGLEVGQTYHFRIIATNSSGTTEGPDHTFTTYKDAGLPDGRRYEQVSPVNKDGSDIDPTADIGMAADDGNRVLYFSRGSFAGQPTTVVAGTDYLSTRGPNGWTTEGIDLPGGTLFGGGGYLGFNADMSKGVIRWDEETRVGPYAPNAKRGENLYLRDSETHAFELVNGPLDSLKGGYVGFVWGSADLSRFIFKTESDLVAGEPCPPGIFGFNNCTYEWDNGDLRIASILPNGEAVAASPGDLAYSGSWTHSMSADGERVFFTYPITEIGQSAKLYARNNSTSTAVIGGSERTLPGGASGFDIDFQNAEEAHGDKVLFTTKNSLVDEDTNSTNDAYLYDFNKPAGERLTLISKDRNPEAPDGPDIGGNGNGAHFGGIAGSSSDLRRIYYVAKNQVLPGKSPAPGPKLFLWDDTGTTPVTRYLGTLGDGEESIWRMFSGGSGGDKLMRLSKDGRYAAFISRARLTPFDNEGKAEIYRYDAETGSLDCVSCSADPNTETPALERPNEFGRYAPFVHPSPYNNEPHNVSDSGQVFFYSEWDLLPRDSNGKRDVYEYENGQLHLISSGTSDKNSTLIAASPSGKDVFFATEDRLVGWDTDQNIDAYDARVNGGFPEPPTPPPACEGDACQAAPVVPNDPTPGSSSFEGAGNVAEPKAGRCGAGKVRRHGRCLKKRHAKKHAKHRRHTTRSHG